MHKCLLILPAAFFLFGFAGSDLSCDEQTVVERVKAIVGQKPSIGEKGKLLRDKMVEATLYLNDDNQRGHEAADFFVKGVAAFKNFQLSIGGIRFRGKDAGTGAVVCVAVVTITYPQLREAVDRQVGYLVERTTDGKSFVSVEDPSAPDEGPLEYFAREMR